MIQENNRLFRKPPLLGPPLSLPECGAQRRLAPPCDVHAMTNSNINVHNNHTINNNHTIINTNNNNNNDVQRCGNRRPGVLRGLLPTVRNSYA